MNETTENGLKESIALNEARAEWSGLAVVFGLIIEVIFAFAYRDHRSNLEYWTPVLSDVIVTLGVAGEILFARKAFASQEKLRLIADKRIAEFNKLAGDANERANQALVRANETEIELEKQRHINGLIELSLAVRNFDVFDFIEAMKPFSGTKFAIEMWTGAVADNETIRFEEILRMALEGAGWILLSRSSAAQSGIIDDIAIGVWSPPTQLPFDPINKIATALADWLLTNGIAARDIGYISSPKNSTDFNTEGGVIGLRIGPRMDRISEYARLRRGGFSNPETRLDPRKGS